MHCWINLRWKLWVSSTNVIWESVGDETFLLTVIDHVARGWCYSYRLQLQYLHTLLAFIRRCEHEWKGGLEMRMKDSKHFKRRVANLLWHSYSVMWVSHTQRRTTCFNCYLFWCLVFYYHWYYTALCFRLDIRTRGAPAHHHTDIKRIWRMTLVWRVSSLFRLKSAIFRLNWVYLNRSVHCATPAASVVPLSLICLLNPFWLHIFSSPQV